MLSQLESQVKSAGQCGFDSAILDITEFSKLQIEKRVEYLSPWLKEGSIGLISGWRGCGKTFFALGILDAVTRGTSFGPWKCENPVPALLLDGEMLPQDIIERANDLRFNVDRQNPLYIYSDAHAAHLGLSRANLTDESWRTKMKEVLIQMKVKFWVIDNLASLAPGLDENIKLDWDPVNQWLLQLRFAGISTLMLHHLGKTGLQRGTSAREDNLDYSITLKTPRNYSPEDGCHFTTHFSKARVLTKVLNQIADMEFKLIQDENNKLIWTCGNVKAENKNEILRLLDEGLTQTEIHSSLNIDKAYISRVRKQAIENGLLTGKNRLTQSGFHAINAN